MNNISKVSKIFRVSMFFISVISLLLIITKNRYINISCVLLCINGIVCSILLKNNMKHTIEYRNYMRHELALEALNGAVFEWDEREKILYISSRFRDILDTEKTIDKFEKFYTFITLEDRNYIETFFYEMMRDRIIDEFKLEFTMISGKNNKISIECSGHGKIIDGVYFLTGILVDVSEKQKQDEILRLSEKKYKRALEGSQDIGYCLNLQTDEMILNGKITNLLDEEYKEEFKIYTHEWTGYIVEEDKRKYLEEYIDFVNENKQYLKAEYRIKTKTGKIIWIRERGKRILEENEVYVYGSISNITESKEKEIKINYMNNYDDITGIPNRRYFTSKAKKMIKNTERNKKDFAIVFMDIDNFKYVNDTYGHEVGDELLKGFCNRIKNILDYNCTLARFGGDEFVISIENIINVNEVIFRLEKIIKACSTTFKINSKDIYTTVSIGVSMYNIDGTSIENLFKKADMAMYKAKASGKNQYYIYNSEIEDKMNRELQIKNGLRKAVENKEIYFELQPKYYSDSCNIQGFECLARWKSKDLGYVSPMEFIDIAESSGMIVPIGNYLIEDAFKKTKEIGKYIKNFKISINLSPVQIRDEIIVNFIKNKIDEYNIDSKWIEFEVTESAIMSSPKKNINILKRLKEIGVSISLDDFGTGYSSMNYLKILPIDTVKIDKSFVSDIGIEVKNEFIISKIIELCHGLGLSVVAEGVETQQQLSYLVENKCDVIQGYYFSKPQKFEDILRMLE